MFLKQKWIKRQFPQSLIARAFDIFCIKIILNSNGHFMEWTYFKHSHVRVLCSFVFNEIFITQKIIHYCFWTKKSLYLFRARALFFMILRKQMPTHKNRPKKRRNWNFFILIRFFDKTSDKREFKLKLWSKL